SEAAAQTLKAAVAQRVKEGIDSEVEGTKARLSAARIHLWRAEGQGAADVLRQHLSTLTGLAAPGIPTEPESFPALPASSQKEDTPTRAAYTNPGVQAALEHARAQYLRADGEHRSL